METTERVKRLPYSFAKTQGVIANTQEDGRALIYHLPNPSLHTLSEVKRLLQCDLSLKEVNESEFQQHLAQVYQSQSSVLDAAEVMEEDMDLSLLADQLPVSEDLLDTQDDAPIIRLLNALFTQAIKQKRHRTFTLRLMKIESWFATVLMESLMKCLKFNELLPLW